MSGLRGVRVAVLGDGIVGLNTAIELARRGADVKVYTETASSSMTLTAASDKACAMWLPVLLDDSRLDRWCGTSYSNFQELVSQGGWFVSSVTSIEMIDEREELFNPPELIHRLPDFRIETGGISRLAAPPAGAWLFRNFVIQVPQHLAKLKTRARVQGCTFATVKFESLGHMLETVEEKVIFNCLGLGSKVVFGDDKLEPVKGHLIFFDPVSLDYSVGRAEFALIPRPDALVAGVLYRDTFDVLHPVARDRDEILKEVRTWIEADIYRIGLRDLDLADGRIRYESTGLRPVRRDGVRLESELLDDNGRLVVHDYGHGGSGITIAYGCAVEAVSLAEEYF